MTTEANKEPEYDLSIITACWNVKENLLRTVGSVLRQKSKGSIRIEHVCVDGASADGTPELLAQLMGDGKIEQYVSEPDKGIYDAMNKGIRMAHGKVLFFLNSDDELIDETDLAELVLPILRNECDMTCGQWIFDFEPDRMRRSTFHLLYHDTPCCHQAFFMAKEWYVKLGGYDDKTYRSAADADMIWKAYAAGARAKDIEKLVIIFKMGGFSNNTAIRFIDELTLITHRHLNALKEGMRENPDLVRFAIVFLVLKVFLYPQFIQSGGRRIQETAERLRELGSAIQEVWKHHRLECCILKLYLGPCLGACLSGNTSKIRQILWRIPALFLSSPRHKDYAQYCVPISLPSRVKNLFGSK